MDLTEELKVNFPLINQVYFKIEDGINFLKIEVNLVNLEELTLLSKEINNFIDENDKTNKEFYLDIFSPGASQIIDKNNLKEWINKDVFIKLNDNIKEYNSFDGLLLHADKNSIIIKWNAKGQFRKQEIELSNILEIQISPKIKKGKKHE